MAALIVQIARRVFLDHLCRIYVRRWVLSWLIKQRPLVHWTRLHFDRPWWSRETFSYLPIQSIRFYRRFPAYILRSYLLLIVPLFPVPELAHQITLAVNFLGQSIINLCNLHCQGRCGSRLPIFEEVGWVYFFPLLGQYLLLGGALIASHGHHFGRALTFTLDEFFNNKDLVLLLFNNIVFNRIHPFISSTILIPNLILIIIQRLRNQLSIINLISIVTRARFLRVLTTVSLTPPRFSPFHIRLLLQFLLHLFSIFVKWHRRRIVVILHHLYLLCLLHARKLVRLGRAILGWAKLGWIVDYAEVRLVQTRRRDLLACLLLLTWERCWLLLTLCIFLRLTVWVLQHGAWRAA